METVNFFHADYRDSRVSIGGKQYPAGSFAVFLLNQYYKNDTAARISVYTVYNSMVQSQLLRGYLRPADLRACGEEIAHILTALPALSPFSLLDTQAETTRICALFTEENAALLQDYFRRRAEVSRMDDGCGTLDVFPPAYDPAVFAQRERLLGEVTAALRFYDDLGSQITGVFHKLRTFAEQASRAERFDESHLLPIASSVFGQAVFPVHMEYIPATGRGGKKTAARRMYFDDYASFILTDLFEGLHSGHYPRRCAVCGRYFLMQSAVRQKYCAGNAPWKIKGKTVTCRKYAARCAVRERAEGDPVLRLYRNRCSAIRVERGRGTVSAEFAAKATALAKRHMQQAREDDAYAAGDYIPDLSRERLYQETRKALEQSA